MNDNKELYITDKATIYESQMERVGENLSLMEDAIAVKPLQFIIDNAAYRKIRERQSEIDIKMLIGVVLVKACAMAGIKNAIDPLSSQDILKMIFNYYSDLTVEEISKAFELERFGVYGDKIDHFQLFDSTYVAQILKRYKKWRQDTKIQHNITGDTGTDSYMKDKYPELFVEDTYEVMASGIISRFDEFKSDKHIQEPFTYVFDWLLKHGFIKDWSDPSILAYYLKIHAKALEELSVEQSVKSSPVKSERNRLKEEMHDICNGGSPKIEVRKKLLILKDFFQHHLDKETDMVNFLSKK